MCKFSNSYVASAEELYENSHTSPSVVSFKLNEARPNLILTKLAKKLSEQGYL